MSDTPKPAQPSAAQRADSISGQPEFGYVNLLQRARTFIVSREFFKHHPLRDTHTNDVPVAMATFAAKECAAAEQQARESQREDIARWLEGQGQPGYAHEVRYMK